MAINREELLVELLAMAARKGWDDARLSAELGLNNQQTLSNWKKRKAVSAPGVENCARVGVYLMGKEALDLQLGSSVEESRQGQYLAMPSLAPVVGQVKGGEGGYFEEIPTAVGDSDLRVPYFGHDPNAFGLRVIGDSMAPRYNHGEYIVACPNIPYARGKYVYVALLSGQKLVKRLGNETVDAFELLSVNNEYKPITILKEDVERICVVQGPFDPDDIRHR